MGALLIGFIFLNNDATKEEAEKQKVEQNEVAQEKSEEVNQNTSENSTEQNIDIVENAPDSVKQAVLDQEAVYRFGVFAGSSKGQEEIFELKNDVLHTEVTSKGGMFKTAVLADGYTQYNSDVPISLWIPEESSMNIEFAYSGKADDGEVEIVGALEILP